MRKRLAWLTCVLFLVGGVGLGFISSLDPEDPLCPACSEPPHGPRPPA